MYRAYLLFIFLNSIFVNTIFTQAESVLLDSLDFVIQSNQSRPSKVDALIEKGKIYRLSVGVDTAMVFYNKALKEIGSDDLPRHRAKAYISMASAYIIKTKLDSAAYYFVQAETLLPSFEDYEVHSSFYGDRAILFYYQGLFEKASSDFRFCLDLAKDEKSTSNIIKFSNNLALVKTKLGQSEEAIDIYYDALAVTERFRDSLQMGKLLNNIGLLFEDMTEYDEALSYYSQALEVKKHRGSKVDVANGTYNVGNIKLLRFQEDRDTTYLPGAEQDFTELLTLSKEIDYGTGELYAYEGLGKVKRNLGALQEAKEVFSKMSNRALEFKDEKSNAIANLNIGSIEIDQGNSRNGIRKILQVADLVESTGDPVQKVQLYSYLEQYYNDKGDDKGAYANLLKKMAIKEQLSENTIKDKLSRYKVKFETVQKEEQLTETRAILAESQIKVQQKNMQIYGALGMALILGLLGYVFYNQQRNKAAQLQKENELQDAVAKIETQNKLNEQRLSISRDLHDNIGAQLTFVISSIENLKFGFDIPDAKLSDRLDGISGFTRSTIGELRDTIWAMNRDVITLEDLKGRIINFIDQARSATDQVEFDFIIDATLSPDLKLSSVQGMNVYRVIQESVNNALKYADAKHVIVQIDKHPDGLGIRIEDNGKGFDMDSINAGNGLANMKKRINELGNTLSIHSGVGDGTKIAFYFTPRA